MAKDEQVQAPVKKAPHDWAVTLGKYKPAPPHQPQLRSHYTPDHAAADVLHGWSEFAYHHQGKVFEISEQDYLAALKAGLNYPVELAHKPAVAKG